MIEFSLVEAVRQALLDAMTDDERVIVLGEDVGIDGGVFRATEGLWQRFGSDRVRDTPLAETAIAGVSIGLAAQGFRPVAEIQFMGFIYSALDQLINHASRLRTRTRGRLTCPMVLRVPYGGGIRAPEHHSESTEALLAHIPGMRVVVPSSPASAYGLLRAAIDDPDPVVVLEPKLLYRSSKGTIDDAMARFRLDQSYVLRSGNDVTLLTWGGLVPATLTAASTIAEHGIEAEVVDVASLKPLDMETLSRSVNKTGRCVVVHEAARSGGVGAEIAATITEQCFLDLRAPVLRVTGYDIVVPLARQESDYLPNPERIAAAVTESLGFD